MQLLQAKISMWGLISLFFIIILHGSMVAGKACGKHQVYRNYHIAITLEGVS